MDLERSRWLRPIVFDCNYRMVSCRCAHKATRRARWSSVLMAGCCVRPVLISLGTGDVRGVEFVERGRLLIRGGGLAR